MINIRNPLLLFLWDHLTDDQKLVCETIQSAVQGSADALEYAEVARYEFDKTENLFKILVSQSGTGQTFRARKLINASGPWVDAVRKNSGETSGALILPIAGAHVTLKRFTEDSVILRAADGRIFFVINIGGTARVGTTERLHKNPDSVTAAQEEIEYLLAALESYFPTLRFQTRDLISTDAGVRPLAKPKDGVPAHEAPREHEIRFGPTGALHLLGVKLTDHRRAAERVLNLLYPGTKSKTARAPLPAPWHKS